MDPAVFGYIRVSQAGGESGLATQRRIFTDVASGRNMRRPAWKQLRGKLRPGDVVVVPRIDRLARNLSEGLRTIEELHGQGIHIRALAENLDTGDDSPTSRLMLHMPLSLAEWERETIRDRIRAGGDRAAAEGRTGGRPPALDSEKQQAVRDFLENGGSVSVAARAFRVSRPTVRAVKERTPREIQKPSSSTISRLRRDICRCRLSSGISSLASSGPLYLVFTGAVTQAVYFANMALLDRRACRMAGDSGGHGWKQPCFQPPAVNSPLS